MAFSATRTGLLDIKTDLGLKFWGGIEQHWTKLGWKFGNVGPGLLGFTLLTATHEFCASIRTKSTL